MLRIACAACLAWLAAGCEGLTQSCTEIGCIDGVTLEVRAPESGFADGSYELEVVAGELAHACTFGVPGDLPPRGSLHEVTCMPRLDLYLAAAVVCTERRTADAVSESCTPIPGQFVLQGHVPGTPQTLTVRMRRDGTMIAEQTLTPAYEAMRPNGPDCDPECKLASVELTLP